MSAAPLPRDWRQALRRGLGCRCPACGAAGLFARFLKPVERCTACGEDLSHQQADDFPPYLVILLVGHILVGAMIEIGRPAWLPEWGYMAILPLLGFLLCLLLIQPVKGGVIALQWAHRMHGFGDRPGEDAALQQDLTVRKQNSVVPVDAPL